MRDNADIAAALRERRSAGEPVVMVGEYFFDLPVVAGLREPVPVVSQWQDPRIAKVDNWQRELAEDALFAPQKAATLLVGSLADALPCGPSTAWAVVHPAGRRLVFVGDSPIAGRTRRACSRS